MAAGYAFPGIPLNSEPLNSEIMGSNTANDEKMRSGIKASDDRISEMSKEMTFEKYLMTFLDVENSVVCRRLASRIIAMHLTHSIRYTPHSIFKFLRSCIHPALFPWETAAAMLPTAGEAQRDPDEDGTEQRLAGHSLSDFDRDGDIAELDEEDVDDWNPKVLPLTPERSMMDASTTVGSVAQGIAAAFSRIGGKQDTLKFSGLARMGKKLKIAAGKDKTGISNSKLKKLHAMGMGFKLSILSEDAEPFWLSLRLVHFESVREFGMRTRAFAISCIRYSKI